METISHEIKTLIIYMVIWSKIVMPSTIIKLEKSVNNYWY